MSMTRISAGLTGRLPGGQARGLASDVHCRTEICLLGRERRHRQAPPTRDRTAGPGLEFRGSCCQCSSSLARAPRLGRPVNSHRDCARPGPGARKNTGCQSHHGLGATGRMYTLIIISFCNDSALALPQAVAFLHWPGARDFKFSIMSDSDLTRPGEPRPLGAAGMPGPPQRWQSVYDSEWPGISQSAGPPP
jgi:hypothetical protein